MPQISRQVHHLKKVHEIEAQKLEVKKNDKKWNFDEILNDMDEPKLDNTLETDIRQRRQTMNEFNFFSSKL